MERFGLFNLLKTFLEGSEKNEENSDVSLENDAPENAPVPEGNFVEEPPEKPNACAEFLARHDARSKRVRK